jgi:hypothetical protein
MALGSATDSGLMVELADTRPAVAILPLGLELTGLIPAGAKKEVCVIQKQSAV